MLIRRYTSAPSSQFPRNLAPKAYYDFLRATITSTQLFDAHPDAAGRATREAYNAELGKTSSDEIDLHISNALGGRQTWVLIGGPPGQAYSLVSRSRNKANKTYAPAEVQRHFRYREYLRIIAEHCPPIFVAKSPSPPDV